MTSNPEIRETRLAASDLTAKAKELVRTGTELQLTTMKEQVAEIQTEKFPNDFDAMEKQLPFKLILGRNARESAITKADLLRYGFAVEKDASTGRMNILLGDKRIKDDGKTEEMRFGVVSISGRTLCTVSTKDRDVAEWVVVPAIDLTEVTPKSEVPLSQMMHAIDQYSHEQFSQQKRLMVPTVETQTNTITGGVTSTPIPLNVFTLADSNGLVLGYDGKSFTMNIYDPSRSNDTPVAAVQVQKDIQTDNPKWYAELLAALKKINEEKRKAQQQEQNNK